MVYAALSALATSMDDYIRRLYSLREAVVELGSPENGSAAAPPNKLYVTLVNVERETAAGIKFAYKSTSGTRLKGTAPLWQLNVYVLVSALFVGKQYAQGIQLLSGALSFLQGSNTLSVNGWDAALSIEPVNLPFSELSNLWSVCGGTYYPSVLCKMRVINVDGDEIKRTAAPIVEKEESLGHNGVI